MQSRSTDYGSMIYNADCYHYLPPFCLLLQRIFLPSIAREAHHRGSSKPLLKKVTDLLSW